jgi:DNA-binding response OmpR family regulator
MAKILVVDDNEQLNSMLKDVLESWGHTVLLAGEGRLCLEYARKDNPDIILLDVMLPGLSGYEVCSELRKNPATASTVVIMITALADVDNRIHGYKLGADNFLVKPINYDELQAILNKYLESKKVIDTMEQRYAVVDTLLHMISMISGRPYDENEKTKEAAYCNKVLEQLHWEKETRTRAVLATLLRRLATLKNIFRMQQDQTDSLLAPLSLSRWLTPVLHYLVVAEDSDSAAARTQLTAAGNDLDKIADFVVVMDRLFTLSQEQPDKELALAMLKREAVTKKYNESVLAAIEQCFNDDKVLEMMQNL